MLLLWKLAVSPLGTIGGYWFCKLCWYSVSSGWFRTFDEVSKFICHNWLARCRPMFCVSPSYISKHYQTLLILILSFILWRTLPCIVRKKTRCWGVKWHSRYCLRITGLQRSWETVWHEGPSSSWRKHDTLLPLLRPQIQWQTINAVLAGHPRKAFSSYGMSLPLPFSTTIKVNTEEI